jgi:thioredoxin reductase
MHFDVIIAGGGPAGLSAALILGRARRRTLLVDAGSPRNAAATFVHGFVTRDGTPRAEFRNVALEQLCRYPDVEIKRERLLRIRGQKDAFEVDLDGGETAYARRILLCVGIEDVLPELPGLRETWGISGFECPYCDGFEHQDKTLGYVIADAESVEFPLLLQSWSPRVTAFARANVPVPEQAKARLLSSGAQLETRAMARLRLDADRRLTAVELEDGSVRPCQVLFLRPEQRQTRLVRETGVRLDAKGWVSVNPSKETSVAGISAAGDLADEAHGALLAAAAGSVAAHGLTRSLALAGR